MTNSGIITEFFEIFVTDRNRSWGNLTICREGTSTYKVGRMSGREGKETDNFGIYETKSSGKKAYGKYIKCFTHILNIPALFYH